MPATELIIGAIAFLQALLLVLPRRRAVRAGGEILSVIGFSLAAAQLVWGLKAPSLPLPFEMLEDHALFRLPRAAMLFSALILGRVVSATREIPESRKPEVQFLLAILTILCDMLVLSRHAVLSVILLVMTSWVGLFLGGLAYRGRREGEAVLKFWLQSSLALALGFGALVMLLLVAGGGSFSAIGDYVRGQPVFSPQVLLVVSALFLPFLIAGGFFPFHFISVDRDHGIPWAVQTIVSVTIQGTLAVAAWKMGVSVFGHPGRASGFEGLRVLQLCGLLGGYWLAVFALSQNNSKRLYSALVGGHWGSLLAVGAIPSVLGSTAIVYAFSCGFIWCAALGFVWARFQEWAGDEEIRYVYGAARVFRSSGLILLIAMATPLLVPFFPGFPSVLYLLAVMIEQKSLLFLALEAGLISLLCLTVIRIITDLLFRERAPHSMPKSLDSFVWYNALDWGVLGGTAAILLGSGMLWHSALASLSDAAALFLH